MSYQLSKDQHRLTTPDGHTLVAVEVSDTALCTSCVFDKARGWCCPVTSTGCSACSDDVRDDGKNIIWMKP